MQKNARRAVGIHRSGGCPSGKVRWKDAKQAKIAMQRIDKSRGTSSSRGDDSDLRIYECDRCKGWHCTSQIG